MASLHPDPRGRSPYLYCAYTLADGTRKFRSTKKKKERDAWKVCSLWADAAAEAGTNHRDLEILNQMRTARGRKAIELPSIRTYFANWLEAQKLHLSESTHKRYSGSIKKLLVFLGDEAEHELQSLTAEQIEKYILHEQKAGLAAKTLNLDLKAFHAALGKAFKRGNVKINVAGTVDTQANDSAVKKAFSVQQIQKLLEAAPDDEWYGVIYNAYYTGLRLGDIAHLKWENLDVSTAMLSLQPDKRAKKRNRPDLQIPVHPRLLRWFKLWKARSGIPTMNGFVFPKLSQSPIEGDKGLSNTFSRLIEKAGIANFPVREKAHGSTRGRAVMAYSFHSIRATFNTQLEAAGVSSDVRMKLSDHTSQAQNTQYTKPEAARIASELGKIAAV